MCMATEIIAFTIVVGTAQAGIGADTPSVTGMDGVGRQVTAVGGVLMAAHTQGMECPQADTMIDPGGNRGDTEAIREALPTAVHQVGMVVDMRAPQGGMGEDLVATVMETSTSNQGFWHD